MESRFIETLILRIFQSRFMGSSNHIKQSGTLEFLYCNLALRFNFQCTNIIWGRDKPLLYIFKPVSIAIYLCMHSNDVIQKSKRGRVCSSKSRATSYTWRWGSMNVWKLANKLIRSFEKFSWNPNSGNWRDWSLKELIKQLIWIQKNIYLNLPPSLTC